MNELREVFTARMDAFPRVAALVEEACARAGFPRPDCLRLRLAVEELFTNTVMHGHGGDSEQPVTITLDIAPGRIALTYEDTAPPHDPFTAVRPPEEASGLEERTVGGLGVLLVEGVVERRVYSYVAGKNCIGLLVSSGGRIRS